MNHWSYYIFLNFSLSVYYKEPSYFLHLPLCKYRLGREAVWFYDSKSHIESIYASIHLNKLRNHFPQLGHHFQLKFTASRNIFAVKLFPWLRCSNKTQGGDKSSQSKSTEMEVKPRTLLQSLPTSSLSPWSSCQGVTSLTYSPQQFRLFAPKRCKDSFVFTETSLLRHFHYNFIRFNFS